MSGKKNPIKKTVRKEFVTDYEPLFKGANQSVSEERRSNSLTPDKKRRQTIPSEIPTILKRNIAALSESSDSIKLTEFGKSFVAVDDKTPPKKKKKSLFDRFQDDDSKNIEIVTAGFDNKHLKSVVDQKRPAAMFASPSMFEKPSMPPRIPRSPEQKFPTNSVNNVKSTAVDPFDKLKHHLNDSKTNAKEEVIVKDNFKDEKTSKEKKKHYDEEKSVTDSSSSSSNKSTKIDGSFIKNFRDSLKDFRQMLSNVKNINDKILVFRQELSEGLLGDFSTPIP